MSMASVVFPTAAPAPVAKENIEERYSKWRWYALGGAYMGYVAAYWVRNNFAFASPNLVADLHFSKTEIGLLSSCLLIAYGLSKGVMSSVADKANPRYFLALGLLLSVAANILLGMTSSFWLLAVLLAVNGIFQGMAVGPCFILLASWFPRSIRGTMTAVWNTSHNVGAGMVAPIAALAVVLGWSDWRVGAFFLPAALATVIAVLVAIFGVGTTYQEGLPPVQKIRPEATELVAANSEEAERARSMTSWELFKQYVLPNRGVWFVSLVDVFVYVLRFGMITWMPLYLLQQKGFTKSQMAVAFLVFEWAAIPATLFSGVISDKYFKGKRMPLAIIAMSLILIGLYFYGRSGDVLMVSIAAAFVGSLVYVPQFLASIQTIELVPPFAVGSAVGLRGFMSYIFGSVGGTALIGLLVDSFGWDAGFYVLLVAALACILFCVLTHREVLAIERRNAAKAA